MITHGDDLLISAAWLLGIGKLVGAIGQTRQTLTSTNLGKRSRPQREWHRSRWKFAASNRPFENAEPGK